MKRKAYIGIDPDVDKSGFALFVDRINVSLECLELFDLMSTILNCHEEYKLTVRLEAGWLIKRKDFRGRGKGESYDVGRNHEIGLQLERFMKRHGISYNLVQPQGYSSYTHQHFCSVTGWPSSTPTNSEKRVAFLMVYGF